MNNKNPNTITLPSSPPPTIPPKKLKTALIHPKPPIPIAITSP